MPVNFLNPFDDPFVSDPFRIRPASAPASYQPQPTLAPEEEEGILARLGRNALGGLGYVGGSLDKAFGGRALRGLLGGKPEEIASLIPFSDALGITDEANAVTGKDLLGYDKGDDSWGGFLGGTAAEMALDPSTYLTLGGKTALGKLAQKAGSKAVKGGAATTAKAGGILSELNPFKPARFQGQLAAEMAGAKGPDAIQLAMDLNKSLAGPVSPAAVASVTEQPLSSLASLSLPFGSKLGQFDIGTGPTAQRIANMFSGAKDAATYSAAGRAITPLFDKRLSEFGPAPKTEAVQREVRAQSDALAGKLPEILGQHVAERNRVAGAGVNLEDPLQAEEFNRKYRQFVEGYQPTGGALHPEAENLGVEQLSELLARREASKGVGRLGGKLTDDYTAYYPRGRTKLTDEALNDPTLRAALGPHNPNDIRRIEALTDVPLGTTGGATPLASQTAPPIGGLNQLFEDPMTKAVPGIDNSVANRSKYVRRKYLGMSKQDELTHANLTQAAAQGNLPREIPGPTAGTMVPNPDYALWEKFNKLAKQSEELVRMSSSDITKEFNAGINAALGQGQTEKQFGQQTRKALKDKGYAPFQNNPLADMLSYRLADEKSNAAAQAALNPLLRAVSKRGGEGMVPLREALAVAGYDNKNARKLFGLKKPEDWARRFVPAELVKDLGTRGTTAFDIPDVLKTPLNWFDNITNLTKGWQTKFYPSTIGRNLFSEIYANLMGRTGNPLKDLPDVWRSRGGQGIASLSHLPQFAGMSPQDVARKVDELAFQFGIDKPGTRAAWDDLVGKGSIEAGQPGVMQPIGKRGNLIEAAKGAGSEMAQGARDVRAMGRGAFNPMNWWQNLNSDNPLNPLGMAGVGGRTETTNALGKLGETAMSTADEYGRKSAFFGLMKQGFTPQAAAEKALALGMDPARLAPFERNVMRRLVPFYGWSRHNLPQMLGNVATEPGGLVGQSVRATNNLRQQEGLVPDYVGEGLAVPIGGRSEEGNQRYLSSFGLPFEDLKNIASSGPHPIQRTGQKLAANLNPLLRNPLEMITGMQFYSGRDLADLYARSGSPSLDPILGMTPLQRPLNVLSTAIDPRKGISGAVTNLLTPARLTDVDMNRALQTMGRRLTEEQLRTNPTVRSFENLYVPADQRASLSPEDVRLLEYYQLLLARARQNQAARPPI